MVNVWGQMGVTAKASAKGSITAPPADKEYAVEPVGVASNAPSPAINFLVLSCSLPQKEQRCFLSDIITPNPVIILIGFVLKLVIPSKANDNIFFNG